jgi:mono/diheme cytochrome c family protein
MTNQTKLRRIATVVALVSAGLSLTLLEGCRSSSPYPTSQAVVSSGLSNAVPSLNFEPTPARVDRGKYIVEGVAHCFMCHSDLDWKTPGTAIVKDRKGAGHKWADFGLPFLFAPNLTPDKETGAGRWSDEILARAIREGVGHDGRRLFPIMPYMKFAKMSDEDLASVIAYLRTLQPVRNEQPVTQLPDEIKNHLPPHQPITTAVPEPDMSDPVRRGEYLVTLANCDECHTPRDEKGRPLPGLEFSGGSVMKGPWGEVATANITPDASGISYYDEALFIETIRTGQVKARKLSSLMPWGFFRSMTDDDLKAIFAYLRTLKPIRHRVDNTEKPVYCTLCGGVHGFGGLNAAE